MESVTDIHMWISTGWLIMGFWLVVLGIALWLKIPQKIATTVMAAQ